MNIGLEADGGGKARDENKGLGREKRGWFERGARGLYERGARDLLRIAQKPLRGAAEACAEAFFPQWKVRDPGVCALTQGALRVLRPHRSDITATPN